MRTNPKTDNDVRSDLPIPTGYYIRERLEELDWTQAELARRMKRPVQAINEIILGKKAVTAETALQLESVIGMSAEAWMGLESDYRLALARLKFEEPSIPEKVLSTFASDVVNADDKFDGLAAFLGSIRIFGQPSQVISDTCAWINTHPITEIRKQAKIDEDTVHLFTLLNKSMENAK